MPISSSSSISVALNSFPEENMSLFRCTSILFLVIAMSIISEFKSQRGNSYKTVTPVSTVTPATIKFQSGNNGQFQWSDNCDYYGGDIDSAEVPRDKCGDVCAQKIECTQFTWSADICWLKNIGSGYVAPTLLTGAACGYVIRPFSISWKIGANGRVIWSPNCDFVASDIEDIASSKDDCMSHCANNTKCTHFSYQIGAGVCWLKQIDSSSITPILTDNVFCGYVSKLFKQYDGNKTNLDWYTGKDYFTARKSNMTL